MSKELVIIKQSYEHIFFDFEGSLSDLEGQSLKGSQVAGLGGLQKLLEKEDRGYKGTIIKCPQCGQKKSCYDGDKYRTIAIIFGEIEFLRAYYQCSACKHGFYPLDEKLQLSPGKYQGRMRKRLEALGVMNPYQKSEELSALFLETSVSASQIRRIANKCSEDFEDSLYQNQKLESSTEDNVYIQIDGNMCPTREPRENAQDNGYREAKTALAFTEVLKVSEKRHEILDKVVISEICDSHSFKEKFIVFLNTRVCLSDSNQVIVIADGARWIWNLVEELLPQAQCILDYAHAKHYLYKASEAIYGKDNDVYHGWVKKQEDLLFADKIHEVIRNLEIHKEHIELAKIIQYLENNKARMLYGTYRAKGYFIGSGAVESVAKSITQTRLKGPGMRWNVKDANKIVPS